MATGVDPEDLTREQCVALLRREHVGRVAVVTPDGRPLIRPVNYEFDDASNSIVFRSRRGSKLYALAHSDRACFEIDSASDRTSAWSVIVTGVVETVTRPLEVARLEGLGLNTQVPTALGAWVRIHPNIVEGRRIA